MKQLLLAILLIAAVSCKEASTPLPFTTAFVFGKDTVYTQGITIIQMDSSVKYVSHWNRAGGDTDYMVIGKERITDTVFLGCNPCLIDHYATPVLFDSITTIHRDTTAPISTN